MIDLKSRSDLALYIWDYFYLANVPRACDEAPWAAIERATHRIRESEQYLAPSSAPNERLRHARRVRNAARMALRKIELLTTVTDAWVITGLRELVTIATRVIEGVDDTAVASVH